MYICNVMRRKLLIHLIILAFFLSSACAYSQNNPLKVNDALYAYVRLVQNNLKVPSKGLLMVDTLFNRAKKLGISGRNVWRFPFVSNTIIIKKITRKNVLSLNVFLPLYWRRLIMNIIIRLGELLF